MKQDNTKTNITMNRSLEKGLILLETLATSVAELSVIEISELLGITRPMVYSLLRVLLSKNYVQRNEENGKYSIDYRAYELGTSYRFNFPFLNVAEKYIVTMCNRYNIKINVTILREPCTAVIILSRDVFVMPRMMWGYVHPAYASASGKVLMASLPDKKLDQLLHNTEFKSFTPHTITSPEQLKQEILAIRKNGYAMENGELRLGHSCIAAPIYDKSGKAIAAASFSGTSDRFDTNSEKMIADIKTMCSNISGDLGYTPFSF